MKSLNLVKAYGEGEDVPYRLGVNFRRLGHTKFDMLNFYSRYDESFKKSLESGYVLNNIFEESEVITIDSSYVLDNLIKKLHNVKVLGKCHVDSSWFEYHTHGFGISDVLVIRHRTLPIVLYISYNQTIHTDGSQSKHWSIEVNAFISERTHYTSMPAKRISSTRTWTACGGSSLSCDEVTGHYADFSGKPIAHSSEIAKLVPKIFNSFVSQYKIEPSRILRNIAIAPTLYCFRESAEFFWSKIDKSDFMFTDVYTGFKK
jgi:hypothetical protein